MFIAVPLVEPSVIEAAPEPLFTASIVMTLALEELAVIVRLVVSVESNDIVVLLTLNPAVPSIDTKPEASISRVEELRSIAPLTVNELRVPTDVI